MVKYMYILIAVLFLLGGASAGLISGNITTTLDSLDYKAGATIYEDIEAFNLDSVLIADGFVYSTLVYYPDEKLAGKVILAEGIASGINLAPLEKKSYKIRLKIPEFVQSGKYRVESYFRTQSETISGVVATLSPGNWHDITISSSSKMAFVDPNNSLIDGVPLMVGPVVDDNSFDLNLAYFGKVSRVRVEIYKWDHASKDSLAGSFDFEANEIINVPFDLPAGAYSVKVLSLERDLVLGSSIFRVVKGGISSRIDKVDLVFPNFSQGDNLIFNVSVLGSADSFMTERSYYLYLHYLFKSLNGDSVDENYLQILILPEDSSKDLNIIIPVRKDDLGYQLTLELFDSEQKLLDRREFSLENKNFRPGIKDPRLVIYDNSDFKIESDFVSSKLYLFSVIKNFYGADYSCNDYKFEIYRTDSRGSLISKLYLPEIRVDKLNLNEIYLGDYTAAGMHSITVQCDGVSLVKKFCYADREVCSGQKELKTVSVKSSEKVSAAAIVDEFPLWILVGAFVFVAIVGIGFLYLRKYGE